MPSPTATNETQFELAILLAAVASLGGCSPACEGAGCEETFDAALVCVQRGLDQPDFGRVTPTDSFATLTGASDIGPDWALLFAGTRLAVGIPDASRVRFYDLAAGGDVPVGASSGILLGETPGDSFGAAIARVPDSDGNGLAELLVGAPRRNGSANTLNDGTVYLLSDLGDPLSQESWPKSAADHRLRVTGADSSAHLGEVVAGCNDMDGDGGGEIVFSAPWSDAGSASGAVTTLAGKTWLVGSASMSDSTELDLGEIGIGWSGGNTGARSGSALDCRSDLTGDGFADLVIGTPFADAALEASGEVSIIEGGLNPGQGRLPDVAAASLPGEDAEAWLGWSVATGDLDGDGAVDIVAGEPGYASRTGRVLVWLGPDLDASDLGTAPIRILGGQPGDALGRMVTVADMDSDGIDDLLAGAPEANPTLRASTYDSGALYRLDGGSSAWVDLMEATKEAVITYSEPQQYLRTGQAVAVGDFDSDGEEDIALLLRHD